MHRPLAIVLAGAALVAAGAAPATAEALQATGPPRVLWSADAETGDLSQWSGDRGGGVYNTGSGVVRVQRSVVRSGRYAMRFSITGADGAAGNQATRIFRWRTADWKPLPVAGYYSAWLYFPRRVRPAQFWNILQWMTKVSGSQIYPTFVLDVAARRSGAMYLHLWDAIGARGRGASRRNLATGRWVHIEAFYRWSTSESGRVTVWQDGRQVIDAPRVRTSYPSTDPNRRAWSLNNYTNGITPSAATIYADDVAISAERLGSSPPLPRPGP
jgi:hypothetical protein